MGIEGVAYDHLPADTKPAFVKDLASQIRQGVNSKLDDPKDGDEIETIDVTIAAGKTPGSVFVTVKVPVASAHLGDNELKHLQRHMEDLYDSVQTSVQNV